MAVCCSIGLGTGTGTGRGTCTEGTWPVGTAVTPLVPLPLAENEAAAAAGPITLMTRLFFGVSPASTNISL